MTDETPVALGMHIRLRHRSTGMLLTALDLAHVHKQSSGQLMVVAKKTYSESTLWQVQAGSSTNDAMPAGVSGKIVTIEDVFRLGEIPTGRHLHSHGDRLGYTQERFHQEVTMWHGATDYNDDWLVEPVRGNTWLLEQPVRLVHKATRKNLHSHQRSDPVFTAGFQEVTAFSGRDDNDLWIAERDGADQNLVSDSVAEGRADSGARGSEPRFGRRAPNDEVCLNALRYAAALVEFFRDKSHDELCFAIYGNWGRGKTYLMELVAELLKTPENEKELPTRVVFFSAWRYPTTPEVWVHLYETLAEAAKAPNLFLMFARNMRVGIAKSGLWPLFLALCAFAFGVMPKFAVAKILWSSFSALLGIGGIILIILMATGIRSTSRRLWRDYLSATRHDEKLGLQATIGKDLKALLEGWLPDGSPFNRAFIIGSGALMLVVIWSTFHWFDFGAEFFAPSTAVEISFVGLFSIASIAAVLLISFKREAPGKVLLVVDDLDRCALPHLLNIIESIKLLVEEPAIQSRMQVAMLVEERVLRAAILGKYQALLSSPEPKNLENQISSLNNSQHVVRDNLEKLFSAHLRLEALTPDEVRDLLYGFGAEATFLADDMRDEGRRRDSSSTPIPESPPTSAENGQGDRNSVASSANQPVPQQTPSERVSLTMDEKDALWNAIRASGLGEQDHRWGPRAVRLLAFRFQLARLVLKHLRVTVSPKRLAKLVVTLSLDRNSDIAEPDPTVLMVAKQVT